MINLFITGTKPKVQRVARPDLVEFIIVDLFCGAGGTTTGFAKAKIDGHPVALVAACVNHDPKALESHWRNHPEVVHFEEDIRTLDLSPLIELVNEYRKAYPHAKVILWASLECTNFSKAKGGQPRDADSRTLADFLPRYITAINPDYIEIENVVEFMSWGPMAAKEKRTKEGYRYCEFKWFEIDTKWNEDEIERDKIRPLVSLFPESRENGKDWLRWRKSINALGYRDEWREMNSADYGAYTSRNRLFGCFAKPELPIVWPEPTHAKNPKKETLFGGGLKKWKPVKEVLDFEDEGQSIFRRKKPLSPRTLERIYAGLVKYVAGGKDTFMLKYNSMGATGKHVPPSVDEPCPTVVCQNRLGVAFIQKHFSGRPEGKVTSVDRPAGTITTVANQSLVSVFLSKYYGNGDNTQSIDEPAGTITTKDRFSKTHVVWLDKTYTGPLNHQSINSPAGSILSNDKHQKVHVSWIDRNFSGGGQHSSIDAPAGSILSVPKMNVVQAQAFILNTNFSNQGKSIDEPAPTLLASRRHYYIVNPSHGGHTMSTDAPCPIIVARQDKAPLYLLQVDNEPMLVFEPGNFLEEDDYQYFATGEGEPSIRAKIIEFMFLYDLSDIKMRMLKVAELLPIQGFPRDYVLVGNQSDQKKFIGNSVVPHVVKSWAITMAGAVRERRAA